MVCRGPMSVSETERTRRVRAPSRRTDSNDERRRDAVHEQLVEHPADLEQSLRALLAEHLLGHLACEFLPVGSRDGVEVLGAEL